MKIKILFGLLILASLLINGCMETTPAPVCGNGIVEEGETSENCCIDIGCPDGQSCEDGICVDLGDDKGPINNYTGIANPASVHCHKLGYKSRINETEAGQVGICIFPDNSECDQWNFYAGKCGQEWSYCKQQGYDIETRSDGKDTYSRVYSVCIDKESKEVVGLVSDLMNLSERLSRSLLKK